MIWSLLLTACVETVCVQQDIQWFEDRQECIDFRILHEELPQDGSWTTVGYKCKLINGEAT
jgi:hypothetical protein